MILFGLHPLTLALNGLCCNSGQCSVPGYLIAHFTGICLAWSSRALFNSMNSIPWTLQSSSFHWSTLNWYISEFFPSDIILMFMHLLPHHLNWITCDHFFPSYHLHIPPESLNLNLNYHHVVGSTQHMQKQTLPPWESAQNTCQDRIHSFCVFSGTKHHLYSAPKSKSYINIFFHIYLLIYTYLTFSQNDYFNWIIKLYCVFI